MNAAIVPFDPLAFARPNSWIAVWAGDESITIKAQGEEIVVPGMNEVAAERRDRDGNVIGGQGRFRLVSARDESGQYVPGTAVLTDVVVRGAQNQLDKPFNADAFVATYASNQATAPGGGAFGRGFTFVKTADEARAALLALRPKWVRAQIEIWRETLRRDVQYRERYRMKHPGQEPPASPEAEAVALAYENLKRNQTALETSTAIPEADLKAMLGGYVAPGPQAFIPPAEVVVPPAVADLRSVGEQAYDEAMALGVTLTRDQTAAVLRGEDEAAVMAVLELNEAARKAKDDTPKGKGGKGKAA